MKLNYTSKTKKEIKDEIQNEISGIVNLIKEDYNEKDYSYLLNLVEDLKEVSLKKEKGKRLSHKKFQKELYKLGYETEYFDLGYSMNLDGYNCILSYDRQTEEKTDLAIWINYATKSIKVYYTKITNEIIEVINEVYGDKGYKLEKTSNQKYSQ